MSRLRVCLLAFAVAAPIVAARAAAPVQVAQAASDQANAGLVEMRSAATFDDLLARLEQAVKANAMGIVAQASASRGAAARGIAIPGNAVVMVFRNDFAVRMLEASIPAGIEAPLRYYVTENADRTATLRYRTPSAVFKPYGSPALDAMARDLDAIFEKIARDAAGR
ncbi:MAG: DUF302 domain-containing protein [Rhodospirillales bacterium]